MGGLRVQTDARSASSSSLVASPLSRSPSPSNQSSTEDEGGQTQLELAKDVIRAAEDQPGVEATIEGRELVLGRLDDAVYAGLLPAWRDSIRRWLVRSLEREMPTLVRIQSLSKVHPLLSPFFLHTSLLGTHTFFMVFVPMPFWFGHADLGRGLLYVLAAGGYVTSVLKDLFCVPRPYSPPLVRLSVGTHALEYGFPSTHSTTTVSMALYFGELLHRSGSGTSLGNAMVYVTLAFIAFSVVFGRLYTGMHSIMDVSVGVTMGVLCWLVYWSLEDNIEAYTVRPGWSTPLTIIPAILFLVFVHPAPAEDCPCFEDAVAFLAVTMGLVLGHHFFPAEFLGATFGSPNNSTAFVPGSILATSVWAAAVLAKLVLGVLLIFIWRLAAKAVCHAVLPPLFRFFSGLLLPRRHYLKATEYDRSIKLALTDAFLGNQLGFHLESRSPDDTYGKTDGLQPIPSILDLPSLTDKDDTCAEGRATVDEKGLRRGSGDGDGATTARDRASPSLPYALRNRGGGSGRSTINDDPLERVKAKHRDEAQAKIRSQRDKEHGAGLVVQNAAGLESRSSVASASAEKDSTLLLRDVPNGSAHSSRSGSVSSLDPSPPALESGGNGSHGHKHGRDDDHIRRDADVLTKVFVYAGIGIMASIVNPLVFAALGLSMPS